LLDFKDFLIKILDEHSLDYVGFFEILLFPMCSHKVPNVFPPSSQWMPWTKIPLLWFHNLSICFGCWIVICQIEKWVHGCIYLFYFL
jgi:hypothetical protein